MIEIKSSRGVPQDKGKRALFFLREEQKIVALRAEIDKFTDNARERMAFLSKQADDVKSSVDKRSALYWKEIESICREKGVLPADYTEKKYHFHITGEDPDSVLFICETDNSHNHTSLMSLLAGLMPPTSS